jgi:hypothetical protein
MTSEQLTTADLANAARNEQIGKNGDNQTSTPLLPGEFAAGMRSRWESIQAAFVDDPRVSVQQADELVASAIRKLAESFAEERGRLERQWSQGNDVSTEDLRQALQRYRAFFHRLLAV